MSYKPLPPTPHTVASTPGTPASRRRARSITPGSSPGTPVAARRAPRAPRPHSDLFAPSSTSTVPFAQRAQHPKPPGLALSSSDAAHRHQEGSGPPSSADSFFTAEGGGLTPAATAATFVLPPLPPGCPTPRRTPPPLRRDVTSVVDSSPSVYGPTPSASAASLATLSISDGAGFSTLAMVTGMRASFASSAGGSELSPLSTRAAGECAPPPTPSPTPTQPSTPIKPRRLEAGKKHTGRSWTMPMHSTPMLPRMTTTPKGGPLAATRSLPLTRLPETPPPKKATLRRQRANTTRSETRAVPVKRRVPKIFGLPAEVLIHVLKSVVATDPRGIAQLATTSRRFYDLLKSDDVLLALITYQLGFLAAAGRALRAQMSSVLAGDATLGSIGMLMLGGYGERSDARDAVIDGVDAGDAANTSADASDDASDASESTMRGQTGTPPWSAASTTPPLLTFSPALSDHSLTIPANRDSQHDDIASYYFRTPDTDEEREALAEELLNETETPDHRFRRQMVSRVACLCHLLLTLYHNTPLGKQGKLAVLSDRYTSPQFAEMRFLVATTAIPPELLPATRALCHFQSLFLSPVDAPVWADGPKWHEGTVSKRQRYIYLLCFPSTPLVDLDGRVVWEEVLPLQRFLFSFANSLDTASPLRAHFAHAAEGVARQQLEIPRLLDTDSEVDWLGIGGTWYALFPGWERPEGMLESPALLEHMDLAPCSPAALADEISLHDADDVVAARSAPGELRQTLLHTHLPWNDSVPPVYFHGDTARLGAPYCVRGVARLTTDTPPEIRVKMVIRRHGHDVVRFDGVYVGGAGSHRGIVGVGVGLANEAACDLSLNDEDVPLALPGWFVKASPASSP